MSRKMAWTLDTTKYTLILHFDSGAHSKINVWVALNVELVQGCATSPQGSSNTGRFGGLQITQASQSQCEVKVLPCALQKA
jgi:hypothetical protein